jgi:hypothetical protein
MYTHVNKCKNDKIIIFLNDKNGKKIILISFSLFLLLQLMGLALSAWENSMMFLEEQIITHNITQSDGAGPQGPDH